MMDAVKAKYPKVGNGLQRWRKRKVIYGIWWWRIK
jgi:hypothetical protein